MKKLLIFVLLIICGHAFAGDWDFFQLNKTSYFAYSSYASTVIGGLRIDSVLSNGSETTFYLNKQFNPENPASCSQANLDQSYYYENSFFTDSIYQRNDTVFYFIYQSSLPFFFLPKASIGQSWDVVSTVSGNSYNTINFTCISNEPETFFGITDSVKTFSMTPNGTETNQTPISNFEFKLSKNYGLIKYLPFYDFLYHPANYDFTQYTTIGINSSTLASGFQVPRFEDYFHLAAGDIRLWLHDVRTDAIMVPDWTEYFRDSITQALITPDSVVYTFDRVIEDSGHVMIQSPGMTEVYRKTDFSYLKNCPPQNTGYAYNIPMYNPSIPGNAGLIVDPKPIAFTIDSLTGDSLYAFSFTSYAFFLDTIGCGIYQILDQDYYYSLNTNAGIIESCDNNHGSNCTKLVAYKINGVQAGNISLGISTGPKVESETMNAHYSNGLLTLNNLPDIVGSGYDYRIFNSIGKLLLSGHETHSVINFDGNSSGVYVIEINLNGKRKGLKFLVE